MAITLQKDTAYTYTLEQLWQALGNSGTLPAYMWAINVPGSTLPPGMAATTTTLSGTPTAAGEYVVRLDESDDYGDFMAAHTLAVVVEGGAPPDPHPEADPLVAAVARYLGRPDNPKVMALAAEHLPIVTVFVKSYTRDQGFTAGAPNADLQAVIISAAARLVVNPEQSARVQVADTSETPAVLNGFTIPELAVLHRYRKRTT